GDDIYVVDNVGDVVTEGPAAVAFAVPSAWSLKGTADFNGDGQTDVLVESRSLGHVQIWTLPDGVVSGTDELPFRSTYLVQGIADVNGDGKKDAIYIAGSAQHAFYLDGTTVTGNAPVSGITVDTIGAITAGGSSGGGTDLVQSSVSYTLGSGVETLT